MSFLSIENNATTPLVLKRESPNDNLSWQANAATIATVRALKASPHDHQSADEERLYSKIGSSKKEDYEPIDEEASAPKPLLKSAAESANTLVSQGFFLWAANKFFS